MIKSPLHVVIFLVATVASTMALLWWLRRERSLAVAAAVAALVALLGILFIVFAARS